MPCRPQWFPHGCWLDPKKRGLRRCFDCFLFCGCRVEPGRVVRLYTLNGSNGYRNNGSAPAEVTWNTSSSRTPPKPGSANVV